MDEQLVLMNELDAARELLLFYQGQYESLNLQEKRTEKGVKLGEKIAKQERRCIKLEREYQLKYPIIEVNEQTQRDAQLIKYVVGFIILAFLLIALVTS